jgi:predicted nucleic acid-binding protein
VAQIFVDTSGWANFFVRSQPQHELAEMLFRDSQINGCAVTTNYVLAALASLLISPLRVPHWLRQEISDAIRSAEWIDLVHVDEDLDRRSWKFMARHEDKEFSLVDCSSFVLMRERGLSAALTTDRHFEQAGLTRLLKP